MHGWMSDYVYTLDELEAMEVLEEGYTANLVEDATFAGVRVWWERTGVADGEPWEETVTVEARTVDGAWRDAFRYNAEDVSEFIIVGDDEDFEIDATEGP